MENDIDWSDEGSESAESAKSTENESQFEDSSCEEAQENVNSLVEEGKSEIDSDFDQDDNTSLQYGVEMADPVCIKLNDLIRRGKIDRSRILYKFLNDVLEIYYNPLHEYDKDVIEFFNTITYLGGRKVACFIRGPMNRSEGRGSHLDPANQKLINLGGPSYKTCLKHQAGYTNEPGVWKPLSLGQLELMEIFRSVSIVKTNYLTVYPCSLANDGTAIKPAIEFDERLKENVGLTFNLDIDYVRRNPKPSADFLKENLVTEAIVSSVTNIDNKCSLPCAVEYSTKSGKTAESCHNMFIEQVKILQTCKSCQNRASSSKNILGKCFQQCQSFCQTCFEMKDVCEECKGKGQVSHHPSLRACRTCLDQNEECIRRAIFVATADCETGNKGAFEMIKKSVEDGNVDPDISLLTVLPDCVHVGKSLKSSFSNWWLKLNNERSNISLLRTLRNRSSFSTMSKMKKLIPRNDHVKNKDRQDPSAVLTLCSDALTSFLSSVDYVCHTIIPELDKFTDNNRLGMYPSPISVSVAKFGWLLFLSWDSKLGSSTLYRARLHSPVDKISVVKKNLASTQVHCENNTAFLISQDGPVLIVELEDNQVYLNPSKITSVKCWNTLKDCFGLTLTGTLVQLRKEATKYLKGKEEEYVSLGHNKHQVNFTDKNIQVHIQAITLVDRDLVFLADAHSKRIQSAQLKYDGFGVCAININRIIDYGDDWDSVISLCVSNNKLFVSHNEGVAALDLASYESQIVYKSRNARCTVVPFQTGILLTDQVAASLFKIDVQGRIQMFAGTGIEGSRDGLASECQFQQPVGLCVEFDSVVYVCDAQSNSLKIITPISETVRFLKAVGNLYDAFSVHKKGQSPPPRTLPEALEKVRFCKEILTEYENSIRSVEGCSKITLNGPQGMVSAATVRSVGLIVWGLERMASLFSTLSFDGTNLLSCMTLDVEHLHSTRHHAKASNVCCCQRRSTVETLTTHLRKVLSSFRLRQFITIQLKRASGIQAQIMTFLYRSFLPSHSSQMQSSRAKQWKKWNYALANGSTVRQRTNRQEITMA